MKKVVCALCVAVAAGVAMAEPSAVVNGSNQLVYTVGEGETYTVSESWSTSLAGIVKEGAGKLVVSVANASFAKPVFVNAGVLEASVDKALGADVVTVASGAAINITQTGCGQSTYYNTTLKNVIIAGTGPDGLGAITFNGGGSADQYFPRVTLSADATIGGRARWGARVFNLAGHTLTVDSPSNYLMFNGTTLENPGHVIANNLTFQGGVTMNGGSANTYTINTRAGGDSYLSMWGSSKAPKWTLVVATNATFRAGGTYGGSTMRNYGKWDGPVVLQEGTTLTVNSYDSTDNCIQFSQAISGAGALKKVSANLLYLDASSSAPNIYTGGTILEGGRTYFNRPAALAGYDQPGRFTVSGSAIAAFWCPVDCWTADSIRTAVNTSTSFAETGHVCYYIPTNVTITESEGFNKKVTLTTEGWGTLRWTAPFTDEIPARIHGLAAGAPLVLATGSRAPCAYFYNENGLVRLEDGTDLDLGSSIDVTLAGTSRTIISNACLRTVLTPSDGTKTFNVNGTSAGAVLEILDGAVVSNKVMVGSSNDRRGAVYQRGGYVRHYARGANDGWCGSGNAKSYGYYELSGGMIEIGGWFGFGHGTGAGVLSVSGGTYKSSDTPFARGGYGRVHMTGGSMQSSTIYIGEQQWGGGTERGDNWVTLAGTGAVMQASGTVQICQRTNAYTSVLNLNAGVLCAQSVYEPSYDAAHRSSTAKSFLNINGGTFRAYAANGAVFGSGSTALDRVTIYEKGFVLDTNGKEISNLSVPFQKPEGRGVLSIAYPAGTVRTGYIGSPEIHLDGGDGEGATAYMAFDSKTGTIGDIEVTSAGWNYTQAPIAWFYTPDRTTAVTCTVSLTEGDLPSGGLVKIGAGEIKLGAHCTYTGETVISNGWFTIMNAGTLPEGNTVRLAGDALTSFCVWTNHVRLAGFGGSGRLVNTANDASKVSLTVTEKLLFDGIDLADGKTLNATAIPFRLGPDVKVQISNTNSLETSGKSYTLVTVASGREFTYAPALLDLPRPWTVYLADNGRTLKLAYQCATMLILR